MKSKNIFYKYHLVLLIITISNCSYTQKKIKFHDFFMCLEPYTQIKLKYLPNYNSIKTAIMQNDFDMVKKYLDLNTDLDKSYKKIICLNFIKKYANGHNVSAKDQGSKWYNKTINDYGEDIDLEKIVKNKHNYIKTVIKGYTKKSNINLLKEIRNIIFCYLFGEYKFKKVDYLVFKNIFIDPSNFEKPNFQNHKYLILNNLESNIIEQFIKNYTKYSNNYCMITTLYKLYFLKNKLKNQFFHKLFNDIINISELIEIIENKFMCFINIGDSKKNFIIIKMIIKKCTENYSILGFYYLNTSNIPYVKILHLTPQTNTKYTNQNDSIKLIDERKSKNKIYIPFYDVKKNDIKIQTLKSSNNDRSRLNTVLSMSLFWIIRNQSFFFNDQLHIPICLK